MILKGRILLLVFLCLCGQSLVRGEGLENVVSLSDDQNKVVKKLGWPATFVVVDGLYDTEQPEGRVETWNYPRIKKVYAFKNGRFMDAQPYTNFPENYRPNPIHPTFFSKKLSKGDLIERLGKTKSEPYRETDKDFGEVEGYYYPQYKLIVCFKEDRFLFSATLFPKSKKGEKS